MTDRIEHTPGPWHYTPTMLGHPDNRINPIVRADQERTGVAYICRVGWQGSTIAGMTSLTCMTLEEAEANARLIAQAPNLLAALKRLTVVGSAATGFLMCDFSDMHEYIEGIMGRPVMTGEMGNKECAAEIREKANPDFVAAIKQAKDAIEAGEK